MSKGSTLQILRNNGAVGFEGVAPEVHGASVLLSSQLQRTTNNLTPERKLMMAIFFQSIGDIFDHEEGKQVPEEDYEEAKEWVASEDGSDLHSFENICHTLGYDSDYIRRLVTDRIERQAFCFRRMYDE